MKNLLFLSADMYNEKMILKFYQDGKIITVDAGRYIHTALLRDPNGTITKHNLITDTTEKFKTTTEIHGNSANESEVDAKSSYIYDHGLHPGRFYDIINGKIILKKQEMTSEMKDELAGIMQKEIGYGMPNLDEYKKKMTETAGILLEPIPDILRLAFDIELGNVEDGAIDVNTAKWPITAISFCSSDGLAKCLVLGTESKTITHEEEQVEVQAFESEKEMLAEAFRIMFQFPCWISYYGRNFDLPYMYRRAEKLRVTQQIMRFHDANMTASPVKSIHLDLYDIFSNPALYSYSFGEKYSSFSLDAVSTAMVGRGKIGTGDMAATMNIDDLARYCYHDSKLTMDLTRFGGNATMNMMVTLSRISAMPIDAVSRTRVSSWIRSMIWYEHRKKGAIIPRREELDAKAQSHVRSGESSITDGKKFRGGMVLEQKAGVHWGMTVLDFASMYPHLTQIHNISYETVMCPHEECKKNIIPSTNYHSCTKNNGMLAGLVGTLRELRVHIFKRGGTPEKREMYQIIAGTIKVFMNATYGVIGSDLFTTYYLPAAEAVTASGRSIISETMKMCENMGIEVLYGDTDSLFVAGITEEQRKQVISETSRIHGAELEVDKEYRFAILTGLKKNYLGIREDGSSEIKGLTGKKSHTPTFIKKSFAKMVSAISEVKSESEMPDALEKIRAEIAKDGGKISERAIPLEDLTYSMNLTREINEYANMPQHVQAAKMLADRCGVKIAKNTTISYVKTESAPYAVPFELANARKISVKKYTEALCSTMDQVLPALGLSAEAIISGTKQDSIESFL